MAGRIWRQGLPGGSVGENERGSTLINAGDRLYILNPRRRHAELEDVVSWWRQGV
jgi:hypothetical protein